MKKKKQRGIAKDTLRLILSGVYGIITTCIMVFALLAVSNSMATEGEALQRYRTFLFLTFLFLAVSRLFLGFSLYFAEDHEKMSLWKNMAFASAFATGAVLSYIPMDQHLLCLVLAIIYLGAILGNRICLIIQRKTKTNTIVNVLLSLLVLGGIVSFFPLLSSPELAAAYTLLLLLLIMIFSLADVLAFAFSKMQLRGLLKIIRKTYVIEILFGLVLLMVAFSFYFEIMEDNIATFWDGLWYSFAVITTIGFGDLTVVGPVSRILTVILGLYGIVVTASITSVIVNYYNEVRTTDKPTEETADSTISDIVDAVADHPLSGGDEDEGK
ncbi:MAG: potassium channel family protein [Bacilli bacterium]|nr:potassium channel family protein [Bacilli bacterium]